ncbi:MAG: MoaD/ThiS family protein [Bacillota bacterium]
MFLYGDLRRVVVPPPPLTEDACVELSPNSVSNVRDVILKLGFSPAEVSHKFVNHVYVSENYPLRDEDRVALFPVKMSLIYKQYFPRADER